MTFDKANRLALKVILVGAIISTIGEVNEHKIISLIGSIIMFSPAIFEGVLLIRDIIKNIKL